MGHSHAACMLFVGKECVIGLNVTHVLYASGCYAGGCTNVSCKLGKFGKVWLLQTSTCGVVSH